MGNSNDKSQIVLAVLCLIVGLIFGIGAIVYSWQCIGPFALLKCSFWIMLFSDHALAAWITLGLSSLAAIFLGIADAIIKSI